MATKKPRINVTIEPREEKFLTLLAQKEHKSVSALVKELILEALERREDVALSALADIRYAKKEETISHDDFWNDILKNN